MADSALTQHHQDFCLVTSEPSDSAGKATSSEKSSDTATEEDRFVKLKAELKDELEKGLVATNDGIKDIRSWIRWIVGTFSVGLMMKIVFYDRHVEEKLIGKIQESEAKVVAIEGRLTDKIQESESRITTMVTNALAQLKLELINEGLEKRLHEKGK
ncbi:hypothetical protein HOY82DRAFT_672981 [Tuber indicum]|nr:hypothetical protein HOY82DRAFT_672981 [Tuber indicum]